MRSKQGARVVDVAEMLEKAAEVVAEFGEDYVYPRGLHSDVASCLYVHPGLQPGCLIGHILVRLGAPIVNIAYVESAYVGQARSGLGLEDLLTRLNPTWSTLGFTFTDEAIVVMRVMQNAQDVGNTWGASLEAGHRS